MGYINQTGFASMCGVTRQAINEAIKKKVFPVEIENGKKKINLENKEVKNYIRGNRQRLQDKQKPKVKKPRVAAKKKPKVIKKKKAEKAPGSRKTKGKRMDQSSLLNPFGNLPLESEDEIDLLEVGDLSELSKYDLDRYKLMVAIEKEKVRTQKEKGFLIDRDIVSRFASEMNQIDSNNLVPLSHSLAPKIAQKVFKSNDDKLILKTSKIIDDEIYKVLKHIQKEIGEFIDTINPDFNNRKKNGKK